MNSTNHFALSLFLLILLAAIWGGSFLFIKVALESITPLTIAAGRIFIAAVFLLIVCKIYGHMLPGVGTAWIFIVSAAVFGNVLPFTLISFGEKEIDSSLASILMSTVPLFNIIIAHILTSDDKVTVEKLLGLAIGFYGIVMLIGYDSLSGLGHQTLHQILVVAGALCYAISGVLSRNLHSLPKLPVAAAILLTASILIVPMSLIYDMPWSLSITTSGILSVLLLGLLSTAAAQLLVLKLLQLRDSSFLVLNNYMVPMFGVLWGMLFLTERPGKQTFAAFLIILAGVVITQSKFIIKSVIRD